MGLLAALAVLAGCSGPAPETEVVCDECVDAVSAVAERTNRSVAVGESATHVYLNRSGDPWVEGRVALDGSGVEALRTNETLLNLVATELTNADEARYEDGYSRPAFDRRGISVAMDGGTLVVGYRVPEVTERTVGGTVFLDRFYRQDGEGRADETDFDEPIAIETDRLVVHGPEGTEPLVEPPGAATRGGRVVWTDDSISTRTYLVFGSPGTPAALATVVTTLDVLAWAGPPAAWGTAFAWVVLVPTLALCLNYTGRVERSGGWSPRSDRWFQALVLAPLGVGVVWGGLESLGSLIALAVVVAVVVVGGSYVPWESLARSEDATDEPSDDGRADGTERDQGQTTADGEYPRVYYEDTATTIGRLAPDIVATPRARERARVAAAAVVVTALLTLVLAAAHTASYAGWVVNIAALTTPAAFTVLGFAVADRARTRLQWTATAAALTGVWLLAFGRLVDVGAHDGSVVWLVIGWGVVASYVGSLLFYAGLWASTR
ncbi:hypothetical protein C475_18238 [Halosimplex carlsbadense 2-9-1]|uniref:Uncharacterized protein n=1 Tax=Halosimplex carlsbadense 2-9-1 TaxID=797114 RepID=M0CIM9_9EURY|nr:hypothetical protein C475_18238 [Halosimplex carlsbadense 2-9-1]